MDALYHNGFFAMGTRCHVVFPGIDKEKADQVFGLLKGEVGRIEACLSRFLPESEVSGINSRASEHPVQVSEEVYTVLKSCKDFSEKTRGAFDISLGPLVKYWKEKPEEGVKDPVPQRLLKRTGMEHVILNDKEYTVTFDNKDVEIDLGGYGKGYALERVGKLLQNHFVKHAFISFGESSVLTLGHHPAGDCWKLGINDHLNPGWPLYTFSIRNGSMSTSGNCFVDDNGILHQRRHVVNPFSGVPVDEFCTVSVTAESPVLAEVLSTAFLVLPEEEIHAMKKEFEPVHVVKVKYESGRAEVREF